jgi:hypothetical protein
MEITQACDSGDRARIGSRGIWHELACDFGRRLYVVEELVPQGDKKRWAQSLAFELIPGGGAVAQTKKPAWMQHILQGAGSGGW